MRKLLVPALLGALVLALAGPAAADKPLIEHIRFDNETEVIPAGELCEFDVVATSSGRLRVATFFNEDGSQRRVMENPSFVTTYTNPLTGRSVTSPDRGLDKITFNEDGTITIHGTGIHFRHKGQFYAIGLWVLTIDGATGELLSAEYHGNFDGGVEDIGPYLCSQLA
jgi:hypothetical protein